MAWYKDFERPSPPASEDGPEPETRGALRRLFPGETIGERLDAHRGWTTGFDYLRIALAVCVLGWHTVATSYGPGFEAPLYAGPFRGLIYLILPMFFSLGGFLVVSSLFRSKSATEYALLRFLRIYPAFIVVVAFTALIAGPILTYYDTADYFTDPIFFRYWLTLLGDVQLGLPGVFYGVPSTGIVNVPLWTIPWELGCSLMLIPVAFAGGLRRPSAFLTLTLVLSVAIPVLAFASGTEVAANLRPAGHWLSLCFLAAVCLYVCRYSVPLNGWLFAGALALSILFMSWPATCYLAPFCVAYVTIYLGVHNPKKYWPVRAGDYSFGLYLCAYPVQQTVAHFFPNHRDWWFNFAVALPLALFCAWLSWTLIEGPVLRHKGAIIDAITRRLGERKTNIFAERLGRSAADAAGDRR